MARAETVAYKIWSRDSDRPRTFERLSQIKKESKIYTEMKKMKAEEARIFIKFIETVKKYEGTDRVSVNRMGCKTLRIGREEWKAICNQ